MQEAYLQFLKKKIIVAPQSGVDFGKQANCSKAKCPFGCMYVTRRKAHNGKQAAAKS